MRSKYRHVCNVTLSLSPVSLKCESVLCFPVPVEFLDAIFRYIFYIKNAFKIFSIETDVKIILAIDDLQ